MKYFIFLLSIILPIAGFCQNLQNDHIYHPGISKELAAFRASQLEDIHYKLDFNIPLNKADYIPASLTLEVTIQNLDLPLILDFNEKSEKILSLLVNGKPESIRHANEHLIIEAENLRIGKNIIYLQFIAGDLSLNRNDDFLYTLLVPDRASTLFPCFDQPDLKANYTLSITAPKDWKVLTGSPLVSMLDKGEFMLHEFGKSDLMSTYLFSFVAGKFETASSIEGLPMTLLYRETNPEKITESIPEIFRLHQQSLDYLENYTGYKFPFQKLGFATIPIFQYGGMEHVGAIQYRESTLFLDQNATDSELLGRAKLIGHETAHMWFGDLVTMKWFNDVWMKEVFAGFMAGKIANPAFPAINHDLLFLTSHYPSAFAEDRTEGTNPIRQELSNLKNAGSVYGSIIYDKAPIMMRQLENAMGGEAFQRGIQSYISTFANGSAEWNDLVEILDKETEIDLERWSEVWVNQSGRPIISSDLKLNQNGTISSLTISQKAEDGSEKVWPQIFDITLIYQETQKTFPISIFGERIEISEVIGLENPLTILYNSNGLGYGVFPMDMNFVNHIPQFENEVMRGQSYINLFENMLLGNINPSHVIEILRLGIRSEKNEIMSQLIGNQLSSVFWKFLTEEQRSAQQVIIEQELWQILQQDLPANLKKTIFTLYSGIAFNQSGRERLSQVWKKEIEILNLKLNPDNYTSLAMNLALFGHQDADLILTEERRRISNSDKLARFDFLVPALSQDTTVRDSVFVSFRDAKNREKEAWVLSACGYIHHPLRQKDSQKHVLLALELVEEIQRTGDIFFPKGWLNNTIGLYTSSESNQIVKYFLAERPNYNPVLRNKILQASDNLKRAQGIIKK